jgi:hypothetical protein
MSLEVNFEILNQKGTPAFFADALANRPAAGFVGRIFVDTNSPSTGMYRDTGTSWINVTGGGAETQTLQNVCDLGNTCTTPVRFGTTNATPSTSDPFIISMSADWASVKPYQSANISRNVAYYASPIFPVGPAFSSLVTNFAESYLAPVSVPSGASAFGGIFSQNSFQFSNVGNNLTIQQAGGLRAASAFRSQNVLSSTGSGTLSHLAGMYIGSVYMPSIFFGTATITNNYALLISNQTEQFVATMVNRWGVYQEGSSDNNYFAGYVGVGSNVVVTGVKMNVEGGNLRVLGAGTTSTTRGLQVLNSAGTTGLVVLDNGNVGIREAAPSARLHIATGGATTASIGLKVRNSADTLDILKTYGTTQVQIASTASALETSAQLQIDSIDRGFLLPRMTKAQLLAIASPVVGLMAYITDDDELCVYKATGWHKISSANL